MKRKTLKKRRGGSSIDREYGMKKYVEKLEKIKEYIKGESEKIHEPVSGQHLQQMRDHLQEQANQANELNEQYNLTYYSGNDKLIRKAIDLNRFINESLHELMQDGSSRRKTKKSRK